MNDYYYQQAKLMLSLLPIVAQEKCFALKGGTAINFFIRDVPRYSVDIDLTYLPLEARENALANIKTASTNIAKNIEEHFPQLKVTQQSTKLIINLHKTQVKIEPNDVIRGTVYPAQKRNITPKAEAEFSSFVSMQVLAMPDLYGGKICAALDRQHPRDLFDIKLLLETEGVTDEIRTAFVVYLASHNRPISEVLKPQLLDIKPYYENDFAGMTRDNISYDELIAARDQLIKTINETLTKNEREFLLSLKMGEPNWELLTLLNANQFPAMQWKLQNIRILKENNPIKHRALTEQLRNVLGLS